METTTAPPAASPSSDPSTSDKSSDKLKPEPEKQKEEPQRKKKWLGIFSRNKDKSKEAEKPQDSKTPTKKTADAENKETPEKPEEKKVHIISTVDELPEDCMKLVKHAAIPQEKLQANFEILLSVLHFRTGKILKTPENVNKPPNPAVPRSHRIKNGAELLTEAIEFKKLYKELDEVGKGGFGTVFHARCVKEKSKMVAIKKMPHVTEKQKKSNFHEAAVLNFCTHPNIVKFLTCHEVKDELWLVMEFMEGGTFEEAARAWKFNENNLAYVAKELLKGISYLHQNQLAHRDLKSANIMMSIHGEVKLIDFGLCADMSAGFPTHMVGSPFWMPPEMIQGKPHTCAVDIWSMAISLLEMANQRPPMIESAVKAMFTVATEGATALLSEPDRWSETFRDFMGKCLKMDPAERASAEDLLQHPFIKLADTRQNMEGILRRIFLSNSLLNSGF